MPYDFAARLSGPAEVVYEPEVEVSDELEAWLQLDGVVGAAKRPDGTLEVYCRDRAAADRVRRRARREGVEVTCKVTGEIKAQAR